MKRRCFAWIEKQFAGDVMLRKDQKKWPSQSQECKNTGQFFRMMSCTFVVNLSGLGQSLGVSKGPRGQSKKFLVEIIRPIYHAARSI
jgi:hypothetical protein